MMIPQVSIFGITGIPEVQQGADLAELINDSANAQGTPIKSGDILVVTQKIVSKSEGQIINLSDVIPSSQAIQFARDNEKDPRHVEIVLQQSKKIIRMKNGVIISETYHGLCCANAGVDASNLPREDTVCLLPKYPNDSAKNLRINIHKKFGAKVAVIISDSFGRPWREGIVNVAIGASGIEALKNLKGTIDGNGHLLKSTTVAIADELAATSGLVIFKDSKVPVAIIRGYKYVNSPQNAANLIRPQEKDLFK